VEVYTNFFDEAGDEIHPLAILLSKADMDREYVAQAVKEHRMGLLTDSGLLLMLGTHLPNTNKTGGM